MGGGSPCFVAFTWVETNKISNDVSTWNPNDLVLNGGKGPSFGGFSHQSRGPTGSRPSVYKHRYSSKTGYGSPHLQGTFWLGLSPFSV